MPTRAASPRAWSRCSAACSTARGVAPEDVVFLAHSTTQATNALLEGDVAPVGIVAIASGPAAALAAKQSRIDGIELAPGRMLHPGHRFITGEALDAKTRGGRRAGAARRGREGDRRRPARSASTTARTRR